jgi:long-subunit acyl-CoA synthetase (AMP-forming)
MTVSIAERQPQCKEEMNFYCRPFCVCASPPQVSPGDSSLSLLPPWHIYQRTAAYYLFSRCACCTVVCTWR